MAEYFLAQGPFDPEDDEALASLLELPGDWRLYDTPRGLKLTEALAEELTAVRWSCGFYQPARSLANLEFRELSLGNWLHDPPEPEEAIRHWIRLAQKHLEDQKNRPYFLARCIEQPRDTGFAMGFYFWILSRYEDRVVCLDLYGFLSSEPAKIFALDPQALGRLDSSHREYFTR